MVHINPIGKANSTVPNWASFKCSWCLIVGMRDAQVEYPKPEIKKKIAAPILNCLGVLALSICASTKIIKHLKYGEKLKAKS